MPKKPELPVPLTCSPQIITLADGKKRCSHSFDNGGCELDTEFMCPFYLSWLERNPSAKETPPDIPHHTLTLLREEKPLAELATFGDVRRKRGRK